MQDFIDNFKTNSKNIVIAKRANEDVQNLLKRCSLIITDYSSVFFDVLYQNKPVIAYQFDEETFRKGQYKEGYFDYHTNPMIHFASTMEEVMANLETIKENNFKCGKKEVEAIEKFFNLRDNENCKRVYEFVKNN